MSHRASFQIPGSDNEFYIETQQGWIYDTETENVARYIPAKVFDKFRQHLQDGYHPDCVICRDSNVHTLNAELTRRADPLITARLACPQECPVTDPEKIEAEIKMREESELTDRAEWQMRQKRNEPL